MLLGKFSDSWDVDCDPLVFDLEGVPLVVEEEDWVGVAVVGVEVAVDTGLLVALDFSVAAKVLLLVIYRWI